MAAKADATRQNIISSAREEFLSAGFHHASMRKIAAKAGVTTGAIYRYFKDKDTLFEFSTADAVQTLKDLYGGMTDTVLKDVDEGKRYNMEASMKSLDEVFDVIYEYFDQFYLLVEYSEFTRLGSFVDRLVEYETDSTLQYIEGLKKYYSSNYIIERESLHILMEAMLTAILEPIRHRMKKEDAKRHIKIVGEFYVNGWSGMEQKICEGE